MIIHQLPESIRQNLHPITIDLVGVGGTGSWFAPKLAKLHLYLTAIGKKGLFVRAYDPKIVRQHIIPRQNFTDADAGENKAICMIEKLNAAYGLSWEGFPVRYDNIGNANITVTCVDDAKLRNLIKLPKAGYHDNKPYYWLDFGNGKDFGQVILGSVEISQPKNNKKFTFLNQLPNVIDKYGDMTKYEQDQGMDSCSTVETVAKQGLFNNERVAIHGAEILEDLFMNNFIDYHGIAYNKSTGITSKWKLQMPKNNESKE